jgi:hypothetical protein
VSSGLPSKADIVAVRCHVSKVPEVDYRPITLSLRRPIAFRSLWVLGG